ncbi:MAG: AAA family ATPase [Candidatus Sericytochromatia bacterium]
MKKLPLGKQTFKDLITENNVYVDKTKDIFNLLNDNSKYFFLSRPRRFGKSLLITTLEEIFLGNQELFKGLYIYDKIEWKKHPVIRIDFNALTYTEGTEGFKRTLTFKLKSICKNYHLNIESNDYKVIFENLIIELSKINKVVILIDEYDKPIVEVIENIELIKNNKAILKSFYETIKSCDEYIKFCFLTGVSKFSKVSVFSSLNNLKDITLDKKYSTMLGYTQEELKLYFKDRINELSQELEVSYQEAKDILKLWYNGYSWDAKNFVYNPFSILNVLDDKKINNYWFKSGTPTLLIKLIQEKEINVESLHNFVASDALLDSFEIDNIRFESLLFQTGYLTIKEIKNPKSPHRKYILDYPNMEVEDSLLTSILVGITSYRNDQIVIDDLTEKIQENDLSGFFDIFKYRVFAEIPNEIFISDKEKYYHTIIYLVLTLIGVRINVEVSTNIGRIDAVIETNNNFYIFEFKMNSATKAIKQIEEKKYYEKYLLKNKPVYIVGVSFDSEIRNIKDWKADIMTKNE